MMPLSRSIVRGVGDPLVGTSPTDTRLALAALLSRAAASTWGHRPGTLWGCTVTGTTGWAYNVAPGALVTSRGALLGAYPAAITGTEPVPTNPAPGSGSRIDIVYALQRDADAGDAANTPDLGVAIGVASATPTAPSIPAGALEIARATVSAGNADTLAAVITQTAPITAVHGGVHEVSSVQALARITSPRSGELAMVGDNLHVRSGGAWPVAWRPPATAAVAAASGYTSAATSEFSRDGWVTLSGALTKTSGDLTRGVTIGTVAAAHRPLTEARRASAAVGVSAPADSGVSGIQIAATTGAIILTANNTSLVGQSIVYLDGVTYKR